MKPRTKSIAILAAVILLLLPAGFVLAQGGLVPCDGGSEEPCKLTDLVFLLIQVINFFLSMSWLIATFFIFWGAYGMATAYGNEEKIAIGKTTFKNAVIGFFMVLIAFLLINWLFGALTGFSLDPCADKSVFKFLPDITAITACKKS